jgi:4-hydroxybenzoate polyprenyltransferase/phosphoserine phosphatase
MFAQPAPLPIAVDLDHTLLRTDTLDETFVHALFHQPATAAAALFALPRGRLAVKEAVARAVPLDPADLPEREELLDWLRARAAEGHALHLCTAAHQSVADAVAGHLGLFESVIGSTGTNLKGGAKAAALTERFPGGFIYAGDSRADLEVWRRAAGIVLVNAAPATAAAARRLGPPILAEIAGEQATPRDWLRAVRLHHASKNLVVFVPLVLGQGWRDMSHVMEALLGFALLLLLTSSTYLLNDLADLRADRAHWSKRHRPIASARIPIRAALAAGLGGVSAALLAGLLVSVPLFLGLAAYLALTLAYSFGLKRVPLLDTLIIALLFGLRILVGVAALGQPVSGYLMTFALFFFFSLATAKRHTEILRAGPDGGAALAARGYRPADAELTLVVGVASALGSLIVLVLYLMLDTFLRVPYADPWWLWAQPLLIAIWMGRIWLLSHRGEMLDDPVSFAIRDRMSWGLGAGVGVAYLLAL